MAGFTIVHLSDLHIGRKLHSSLPTDTSPLALADLTAEELVRDFERVARNHAISFRTEETLLIITGDITHQAKWEQYEIALYFIDKLQMYFCQHLQTDGLAPEHIICIPGNHDIEVPERSPDDIATHRKTKYRNFKLFLDEVTNHSAFANGFKLDIPFVNVHIPTPFQVQFLDINTTLSIACFSKEEASSRAFVTLDHLQKLTGFLKGQRSIFRVALTHYQLADFPAEDSNGKVSQGSLRDWLIDNEFKLVLCGHSHSAVGMRSTPVPRKDGLLELGTGNSFLLGGSIPRGNHYQIIRIEPSADNYISLLRRMYSWRGDPLDRSINYWGPTEPGRPKALPKVSNLMDIVGALDYKNFIGIHSSNEWAVIAHCESSKFQRFGVLSPGEQVNANLLNISGYIEGNLERVDVGSSVAWNRYAGRQALFLVDSPHYNPYVRSILDNYGTYLAGGTVRFYDIRSEKPVRQRIRIHSETLVSGKTENMKLFDEFTDYLLVMRLPGFIPRTEITAVEVSDIDRDRVIWVIAGIHSKASYAGAMIFTPRNLQLFATSLQERCGGQLPEYFEAVYRIPKRPERIDRFTDLRLIHFRTLRLRSEIGMADDLPSGVAVRFLDKTRWHTIPIETVHLDPVAACNFECPKCIEKEMRQKSLFLSMSTCVGILCDLKEVGCQHLNFYGGEPTLHPDFHRILKLSYNLGFDMLLVTNGNRLGERKIQEAIVSAKDRIHVRVSIDGHSKESHRRHHGLPGETDCFADIVAHVEHLIQQGVSVTITFLLHRDSISEIADSCSYWKGKHASAFILRPLTDQFGKSPELSFSEPEKDIMRNVLNAHIGFAFTPSWFQDWLCKDRPVQQQQKGYDQCYSGYYRIAVSPYETTGSPRKVSIEGVEMVETSNAWISFCTYRRYDAAYGCEYPQNLRAWCQTGRQEILKRIDPTMQCNGVICCRHEYNKQIQDLILYSST